MAHCLSFIMAKMKINRVVHIASGEHVKLAVEMVTRKYKVDLPNTTGRAMDTFCYKLWKIQYIGIGNYTVSEAIDVEEMASKYPSMFYWLMEVENIAVFRPKERAVVTKAAIQKYGILLFNVQYASYFLFRIRNAFVPGYFTRELVSLPMEMVVEALPFEAINAYLPEEVLFHNNFLQSTPSASPKIFHRLEMRPNDEKSFDGVSGNEFFTGLIS